MVLRNASQLGTHFQYSHTWKDSSESNQNYSHQSLAWCDAEVEARIGKGLFFCDQIDTGDTLLFCISHGLPRTAILPLNPENSKVRPVNH